jgi:ATP-binding cassette subfamily F protein 3
MHEARLDLYPGGYDDFERQREERARVEDAMRQKVDAQRAHLQSFVDRFRATASKAVQAQSRLKMIARLPPVSAAAREHTAPFLLPSPPKPLAPPLLRMEQASVGYEPGKPVLKGLSLRLDLDDRIGLLGVNGAGKSTFARLVAGDLAPEGGEYWRDRRLKVGWFHQHQIEALDPTETPLDILRQRLPEASEASRRSRLAQWGLGVNKVDTTAANLSGGERARLLLNLVAMEAPHLLILDEPTNHLDIDSRRALLDALNDYEGAVILITHDRSLMELVADRLWLAEEGSVRPFEGDVEAYAKRVIERARQAARDVDSRPQAAETPTPEPQAIAPVPSAPAKPRAPTGNARRQVEATEAAMTRASNRLAEIDCALADPKTFSGDPRRSTELGKAREGAQAALDAAEQAWLVAVEALEALKA